MKDKALVVAFCISIICLFVLAIVNIVERTKLEKRVDFLQIQWEGKEFWKTNTVWNTNYMTVIVTRMDEAK